MPAKRPPPTALEREALRKDEEAARRSAARAIRARPPGTARGSSFARRVRAVGAKVDAKNDGYAPAIGAFDLFDLPAELGDQASPYAAAAAAGRDALLLARRGGSRAELGWARWRRLRAWVAARRARRDAWFDVVEAATRLALGRAAGAAGRRRRGGLLDGGALGLERPRRLEPRGQASPGSRDEPELERARRDREWRRLTRPAADADAAPRALFGLRQSSIARFLGEPASGEEEEEARRAPPLERPASAEPTPLAVSPGRTAFALPGLRAFPAQLPPLTVEQLGRRAAPPELHCAGTLRHDGMLFTPHAAAAAAS